MTQTAVPHVNRLGASPGKVLVLSGLSPSLRISVRNTNVISIDVLCKAKSQARFPDAQITAITPKKCVRNMNLHLFD